MSNSLSHNHGTLTLTWLNGEETPSVPVPSIEVVEWGAQNALTTLYKEILWPFNTQYFYTLELGETIVSLSLKLI